MPPPSDTTIAYYEAHASAFYDQTVAVDMTALYTPFLSLLTAGAHILDAGCGSGRDSFYFLQHGYKVTAFDASTELAARASRLTQQPVHVLRFEDVNFREDFDGIWACASLLHVPRIEIDRVVERLSNALKPKGVMFVSFKLRDGEWEQDGRFFNGYERSSFEMMLERHSALRLLSMWISDDVRPEREGERWLNALLRRQP